MRRHHLIYALCAVLIFCLFSFVPYTLKAQAAVQVTTTAGVNLRSAPQTSAAILTVVPAGTTMPAIGRNQAASWIQVTFQNATGWLSAMYLKASGDLRALPVTDNQAPPAAGTGGGAPAGAVTATVGANGISVREQPSATSKRLALLPAGTTVVLTGRQGSGNSLWVQFAYQGQAAWMAGWLVRITGDINSLPAVAPTGAAAGAQPAAGMATLIIVNQLATTLHLVIQGPMPVDTNMGPNSTLTFAVTPGTYVLVASAQDRIQVSRTVRLAAGGRFTWILHG